MNKISTNHNILTCWRIVLPKQDDNWTGESHSRSTLNGHDAIYVQKNTTHGAWFIYLSNGAIQEIENVRFDSKPKAMDVADEWLRCLGWILLTEQQTALL